MPNAYHFLIAVWAINLGLLVFNMLPVYPLDGGQILRSLLWFVLGQGRSLLVATVIGFVGTTALLADAIWQGSLWTGLISLYLGVTCWASFKSARAMVRREKLPRRTGFACPRCGMAPPVGPVWRCDRCTETFDPFVTGSACPNCGVMHENTMCVDCHQMSPVHAWEAAGSCVGSGVMSSSFETR
jgi:DNA-directed RNA polymerase subunit RPC12/RpoP